MAVSRSRKDGRPCEASRASATMSWDHSCPAASTSSTTAARGPTHLSSWPRFQPHEYPSRAPQSKRSDVDATQSGARLDRRMEPTLGDRHHADSPSVMAPRVVLTTRMTSVVTRPPSSITMTAPSGATWISSLSCGPRSGPDVGAFPGRPTMPACRGEGLRQSRRVTVTRTQPHAIRQPLPAVDYAGKPLCDVRPRWPADYRERRLRDALDRRVDRTDGCERAQDGWQEHGSLH